MPQHYRPDIDYIIKENQSRATLLVILRTSGISNNNQPLKPNQRAYFDPNNFLRDKKITSIEVPRTGATVGDSGQYASLSVLPAIVRQFTITLIQPDGKCIVSNMPLTSLYNRLTPVGSFTFGKRKIFDATIDLQKSFITLTYTLGVFPTNSAMPFLFSYLP